MKGRTLAAQRKTQAAQRQEAERRRQLEARERRRQRHAELGTPPSPLDKLYGIAPCGVRLGGKGPWMVYKLLKAGELESIRIGKRQYITERAVREYLERQTIRAAEQHEEFSMDAA